MKCFHHNEKDAVATCQDCGKGLCVSCSDLSDVILCQKCLLRYNKSISFELYLGLAITLSLFIGFMYFFGVIMEGPSRPFSTKGWVMSLLLAFTYWGWKFLTDHFPRLTGGTGDAWIIYFVLKFIVSYFIGVIVGPYQIFKMFRETHLIRKTAKQTSSLA